MDYPRKRGAVTPVTNLDVWRPLIACLTFVIETIIKAAVNNIQIQTCVDCFFFGKYFIKNIFKIQYNSFYFAIVYDFIFVI